MNRIYQGKVTRIIHLTEDSSGEELELSHLEEHHQLFQDGINYYLVALAAMAADEKSPLGQMRARMAEAWEPFTKEGANFDGLRASLLRAKIAGIGPKTSFEEGLIAVLAGNAEEPSTLQLAADLLLSKVSGDAAIQQGGRGYWPRLCNPKADPTWDFSPQSLRAGVGKEKLATLIHSELADSARQALAKELALSWTVKVQPGKFYDENDSRKRLQEAVDFFAQAFANPDKRLIEFLSVYPDTPHYVAALTKKIDALDRPIVPRNRKAAPPLVFATLLFKFFPSQETQALLTLHVAKPKENKKADTGTDRFSSLGDDPIKLARGQRGYVFPAFTSLSIFGSSSPEDIRWGEFDIAAFKEALKTVNQFRLKTEERQERHRKYENAVAYMKGQHDKWEDPDGAEESDPPCRINGDPRIEVLERLLKEQVEDLEIADADTLSTTLSGRRLRGWSELAEKFNRVIKPGEIFSQAKLEKLKSLLAKHQAEHRYDMGDAGLFRAVIENADCWCLWQAPTDDQRREREKHDWPDNILATYRHYLDFLKEIDRLQNPIQFTPADASASRRLFMFSDLAGRSKIKHRANFLAVDVSLALENSDGVWEEKRVQLHYSAPRLRRDRLRGIGDSEELTEAPWMQPMMEALGIKDTGTQDISGHAVSLMPEPGKKGMRFLLNFPIAVDSEKLAASLGKNTLWANQFNGTRDKHIHLHWPSTMDAKHHENAWWQRGTPFTCLAVDLGTRACAAIALMEFLPGEPVGHERLIGRINGQPWKARLFNKDRELLRLAGEDMKVLEKGEWRQEPFGAKGRAPDDWESRDFERWLEVFQISPDNWLARDWTKLSFPEQNDRMLKMFRQAQGRNMELNRWLRFLVEGDASRVKSTLEAINEKNSPEDWKQWAKENTLAPLKKALHAAILAHQETLKREIVLLANRILPLRSRKWEWVQRADRKNWILRQTKPGTDAKRKKIQGQRGMSIARIEQIESLRQRLQSLNRALQRVPGEKAPMGKRSLGSEVPDPCPDIKEKLEELKKQRTNQTSHLILAKALGVRLKSHSLSKEERRLRDVHGEYERSPGRKPADFIVLEDLSRYRTSQDRAPSENSRLMKWCHRAVTEKLKQLCEPYGIPVLETPAAYTSKFCSRTGFAGFRAREIRDEGDLRDIIKQEKDTLVIAELLAMLNALKTDARKNLSLLVPARGGPRFLAAQGFHSDNPKELSDDADLNAACNLALRAVAAPYAHDLLPRLRCKKDKRGLKFIGSIKNPKPSKRDAKRFEKEIVFQLKNTTSEQADRSDNTEETSAANVFLDLGNVANFEKVESPEWPGVPLATSKGIWGTIKNGALAYCLKINRARFKKWGIKITNLPTPANPDAEKDVPFD